MRTSTFGIGLIAMLGIATAVTLLVWEGLERRALAERDVRTAYVDGPAIFVGTVVSADGTTVAAPGMRAPVVAWALEVRDRCVAMRGAAP